MGSHGRREHHRTVDRVAALLEAAARAPVGLTTAELARASGAPTSSVQGLVNGLVATGFLLEQDRRFRLGPAPHVLNLVAGRVTPPITQAELNELGRVADMPVLLAVRVGSDVVYLARGGPDEVSRLAHVADEHHTRPLLRTAAGRLLAALAEEADRRDLLDVLRADEPDAVTEFEAALPAIRAARIAHSEGLADPDVSAVALPLTHGRAVIGALVLIGEGADAAERRRIDAAARRVLDVMAHAYP